ncbi:MAG: TrkA family potassium uptake protein [Chloroflexi bacterium]|nr:TrkA family potassium uptake protein [Chloroflexota bacterium]
MAAKKQVVVVGLGRFGSALAQTLFAMGHDVLALDKDERSVQEVSGQVTHAVQVDVTDEQALKDLGVTNFDVAIVGIGTDIQSSVLSTVLLKRLGIPYVIARAANSLHATTLSKVGADKVVFPEQEAGERLAHSLASPNVLDFLSVASDYNISTVVAPKGLVGQTLVDLRLGARHKFAVTVLAIRRGRDLILMPDRSERIRDGDILVVAGKDDQVESLAAAT